MSLYHKYRPKTLKGIRGNKETVRSLDKMLDNDPPHAILLHGPTGCGKTTIGRIIGKRVGAVGNDFVEIDSADFRGIDTAREIRKRSLYYPLEGDVRVWLIDECHKMTNDAQNALLKGLEDPPSHVYFILCTTEPTKLLKTIRGRCQQFALNPLDEDEMVKLLKRIAKKEGSDVHSDYLEKMYELSFGHPRNAINILERFLTYEGDDKVGFMEEVVEEETQSIELCRLLMNDRSTWKEVASVLDRLKHAEPESIRRHVIAYADTALKRGNEKGGVIIDELFEPLFNVGHPGLTLACYNIINS